MSDQESKTKDDKPISYSRRMIEYIESNPLKIKEEKGKGIRPNITQISTMINNFSMDEYEKRKEKTDEMPFGKYKFKKVVDVALFDKQYLKWLVKQDMMTNYEDLKNEILMNI